MQKIESFTFALEALKQLEVLCSRVDGQLTSYRIRGERVSVTAPNAHYLLTIEQFRELFGRQPFYLYDQIQQAIDPEKDDEYYAWKNQRTN